MNNRMMNEGKAVKCVSQKYHLSSSRRRNRASRIRFTSFLPLCSPWRTLTLVMTFFHPASSLSLRCSSLSSPSLRMFSSWRSRFSAYLRLLNSSSCLRPYSLRWFLSCHSFYCMVREVHFFHGGRLGCVLLLRECVGSFHLPRSRWSRCLRSKLEFIHGQSDLAGTTRNRVPMCLCSLIRQVNYIGRVVRSRILHRFRWILVEEGYIDEGWHFRVRRLWRNLPLFGIYVCDINI